MYSRQWSIRVSNEERERVIYLDQLGIYTENQLGE